MGRVAIILSVIIMCTVIEAANKRYSADVIRVTDGDSVTVKLENGDKKIIRLFGIDAPEMLQKDGPKSGRYLATRVGGESIQIEEISDDQYGRTVAMVYDKNNRNLNLEMVEVGLAWVYRKYYMHPLWISLEKKAKEKKIGIWRRKTVQPPWEYRSEKKRLNSIISNICKITIGKWYDG